MKAWKVTQSNTVKEVDWQEPEMTTDAVQVKITKALITSNDIINFDNDDDTEEVVPGSYGIGIVTEIQENIYNIARGDRVYISPISDCGECHNCMNNFNEKCIDFKIAGANTNGFLRDFCVMPFSSIHRLPSSVSDLAALNIDYICKAIAIIDKLDFKKGDHIAVIGGNTFGNILAQLIIYYRGVPILVDDNQDNLDIAKKSGIYYTILADSEMKRSVSSITGGRYCDSVVYVIDSDIAPKTAFNLAGFGTPIIVTGTSFKSTRIDISIALKNQLDIMCLSNGFGNIGSAINLIINKAVVFDHLKINEASFEEVPAVLEEGVKSLNDSQTFTDTVINLM